MPLRDAYLETVDLVNHGQLFVISTNSSLKLSVRCLEWASFAFGKCSAKISRQPEAIFSNFPLLQIVASNL